MRPPLSIALLCLAACEQVVAPTARYDTAAPGSLDQAMCRLGFTVVPLRTLVTGHHLVDARLNGRPARLIVDTGANVSVLHTPYAADFGIDARPVRLGAVVGIGGGQKVGRGTIRSLSLGPVPVRLTALVTTDLSPVARGLAPLSGGAIHGIIGQDVMRAHHAVIDVPRALLWLVPGRGEPRPVPASACSGGGNGAPAAAQRRAGQAEAGDQHRPA